ncbi:unnamed protein product [Bathycoccus prasinos]|mmetsp:Transcript_6186/g.19432  ORF Transcript_6186/g.19432 Transcript_6186/m.19432 type:complete len:198 (+) Transcript_6186:105-698(+)
MSVQSSLQATTSLVSQTKHLSNQFRKSCSVKASTTTSSSIDTNTFALHGKSGRKCMLTGKRANNGYTVSFSHIRNKKLQQANLQYKRVYWPEQKRYIRLRISTKAIKTLNKVGLEKMAKDAGLDLMSLAYQQADEARAEWLAANAGEEPTRKDKRAPTGPKKLFIPKWKEARMSKLSPEAKDAETKRFAEKYNMTLA